MSKFERLKRAWSKVTGLNSFLNSLPISKQASVKIPAGIGLFFFCWLAFDQVKVQNNYVLPRPPEFKHVPSEPPKADLPVIKRKDGVDHER